MSFVYQVVCNGCPYRSEVVWPLWACYRLPSEHTPEIAQQLCWCSNCQSVTVADAVTDLERIERLQALPIIANAYDEDQKAWAQNEIEAVLDYTRYPRLAHLYAQFIILKRWDVRQSVIMKNSLALHRDWRLLRTSPPRCLACGGSDFVPFMADEQGEPLSGVHPNCGGALSLIEIRKERKRRYLWTSEGEPLGAG